MDLILLILAASPSPMLASSLAELAAREAKAVRVTLLRLQKEGLAARKQVNTQGPQGTFVWSATKAGAAAAREVLGFIRAGAPPKPNPAGLAPRSPSPADLRLIERAKASKAESYRIAEGG